ncbi:MAG: alpha/beta fold hydrolase [Deltaproteobacteria bacterium]|nr:alpha/beta fold hydrolase [Deltaproteobacteria bacterium]
MKTLKASIPIAEDEMVSGVFAVPADFQQGKTVGVILAHGAGNDMENPLIVFLSNGLAEAGFLSLRFNFPYKERNRKAPDSQKKLVRTWRKVYRFLKTHPEFGARKIVAAGKSMGGRVASQMAADNELPADRLIFLGYPLHPPGKKDKLRDAHLYELRVPLLFFAGTRDTLCDLDLLRKVLGRLKTDWDLEVIKGGDHSFGLLKSANISQQEVYDHILQKMVDWLKVKVLVD